MLVALPILVQGELAAADARRRVHADQLALTQRIAQQAAATLNSAVVTVRDQIAAVAIRPNTGKPTQLIEALQENDRASLQTQLETLESLTGIAGKSTGAGRGGGLSRPIGTIVVADADGVIVSDSGAGTVGGSIRSSPAWSLATKASPVQISPVYKPFSAGVTAGFAGVNVTNISFEIVAYVDRAQGDRPAYVDARLSPALLAQRSLEPLLPSADELYVVDASGHLVLRKSHMFAPDDAALVDLSERSAVATSRAAETAAFDGEDPMGGGARSIGSAVLPDLGWRMIVAQNVSATERDLESSLQDERTIRGLLSFLLVGATYFVARGAAEVARQRRSLAESLEQQTASAEILRAISQARDDAQPVLQAIVERAMALCGADGATLYRREGEELVSVAAIGDGAIPVGGRAIPQGAPKRAIAEGRTIHIPDARSDPLIGPLQTGAQTPRVRLAVPILQGTDVIGVIRLNRWAPRPFAEREIALVEAFAAQAAIAIENVRLFNETREALRQQTAISELLKTISRTVFDLQPTLRAIVENATRLADADAGWLTQRAGPDTYQSGTVYGRGPELHLRVIDASRERARLGRPETRFALGRSLMTLAYREGRTMNFADLVAEKELYENSTIAKFIDARSVVCVPVRTEEGVVAAMVLARVSVRPFSEREVRLIETFADQAAIAIANTRLVSDLRDTNIALKDATEAKSRFLANMSHELRTPLNAIIGFADILLQGIFGGVNAKQREYLSDILGSGEHQLALINDLLDLSKIEAGRLELALGPVAISDVVASSVVFVRERAAQQEVLLDTVIAKDLPLVQADGRKLRQIVVNLLANAVKFTPAGGRVTASASRAGAEIRISVADTGVGIAPDDQRRLFEEFSQARQGRASGEGTGLGLALSKKLVELHGGRMWVDSALGQGSTFAFTIPIVKVEAPTRTQPASR